MRCTKSLPIKLDLQRTFTSAMQFYRRDFEQLHPWSVFVITPSRYPPAGRDGVARSLVVKNGSKMRSLTSSGTPAP